MLREVKNKHIKPRIVPFQLTTTASGATMNIGYNDFTVTRPATAGAGILTIKNPFYRNGLFFANQSTVVGGYVPYNSATNTKKDFPYAILDGSGTATEGSCEGFVFGWDSPDLSLSKVQRVAAAISRPRIVWGKITGSTGVVTIGKGDFGCTRTSGGVYNISFRNSFGTTPVVLTSAAVLGQVTSMQLSNKTAGGVTVTTAGNTTSPGDRDFYICAIGSGSTSDSGNGRMPLENSQRNPRIIVGQVTMTSGVPSLSIGGTTGGADFVTLADLGAGNFSMSFAEPFKREPGVFLTTTTQRARAAVVSASAINLLITNAAGTATDVNGVTNFFIIGSDDASEY